MTTIGSGSPSLSDIIRSRGTARLIQHVPAGTTMTFRLGADGPTVTGKALDVSNVRGIHISELPEDMYQEALAAQERMLEQQYTTYKAPPAPDTSWHPGNSDYAKVVVGGQVVAEINNFGYVTTQDNALGTRLSSLLGDIDSNAGVTEGPSAAKARADAIAKMLGGRVITADTALTQSQFDALPKLQRSDPVRTIDYEAMRFDPMFDAIEKLKQARADYLAEQAVTDSASYFL